MIRVFLLLFVHLVSILFFSCKQDKEQDATLGSPYGIDTIPFSSDPQSNIITLEGIIQGNEYHLIFDTGAPNTILNSKIPSKAVKGDTFHFYNILFNPCLLYRLAQRAKSFGRSVGMR